jgi:hypothetical protein
MADITVDMAAGIMVDITVDMAADIMADTTVDTAIPYKNNGRTKLLAYS